MSDDNESVRLSIDLTVIHCVTGAVTFELRWCNAISCLPTRQLEKTAVGSKCCNTAGLWFTHIWTHDSALHDLHWLRVPEHITFRFAVLVYRCLHGVAPPCFDDELQRVADIESRQWPASTTALVVPSPSHSTFGDHAFFCCCIPQLVTWSPSLSLTIFWRRLKTELYIRSYGSD